MSAAALVTGLVARCDGAVVTETDAGWEAAVAGHNTAVEQRPDAVVRARSAADVAAAVAVAAEHGARVAVLATGHTAAATGPGTVLVRTDALDTCTVDARARTAQVGAGTPWHTVVDQASALGLGCMCGSAVGVGAVGHTVGGGLGPVSRSWGWSSDHVRSLDVVLAEGRQVRADPEHEPELFWGLRGGGAALGLVTAMTVELPPCPDLYGGGLYFGVEHADAVLHAWAAWTGALPDAATTSIARLNLPNAPALPAPLRGRQVVHVRFCHLDDDAEAQRLLAPLRAVAPVLLDTAGPMPFARIGSVHADPVAASPVSSSGALLADLPPAAVDAFLEVTSPERALPFAIAELRLLGGVAGRAPATPDAVGGRGAALNLFVSGVLVPAVADAVPPAVADVVLAMAAWDTGGALLNFAGTADDDATRQRVAAGLGPQIAGRLRALRAAVDPDGVFTPAARW